MGLVFEMLKLLGSILYLIILIYCCYKFLTGDKEEKETFWYGIATIILML